VGHEVGHEVVGHEVGHGVGHEVGHACVIDARHALTTAECAPSSASFAFWWHISAINLTMAAKRKGIPGVWCMK
jgi:hypothetical protein